MKEIGGYFELELHKGGHYHPDALHLNTGRNCFEYILRAKGYKKVYIPYYTCCLLYTSPSPRDAHESRMPSSA